MRSIPDHFHPQDLFPDLVIIVSLADSKPALFKKLLEFPKFLDFSVCDDCMRNSLEWYVYYTYKTFDLFQLGGATVWIKEWS